LIVSRHGRRDPRPPGIIHSPNEGVTQPDRTRSRSLVMAMSFTPSSKLVDGFTCVSDAALKGRIVLPTRGGMNAWLDGHSQSTGFGRCRMGAGSDRRRRRTRAAPNIERRQRWDAGMPPQIERWGNAKPRRDRTPNKHGTAGPRDIGFSAVGLTLGLTLLIVLTITPLRFAGGAHNFEMATMTPGSGTTVL